MRDPSPAAADAENDPRDPPDGPEPAEDDAPGFFPVDDASTPALRADSRPLIDFDAWHAAQAVCAASLARAALAVGRLDHLTAAMGQGAVARLAATETEHLLWTAGTPVPADDLGRDLIEARAGTDLDALKQGRWAIRRLTGQGDPRDPAGFLGLYRAAFDAPSLPPDLGLPFRLQGTAFDEAAADLARTIEAAAALHPIARGALARLAWGLSDLSPEGDVLEGAVWAARIMAADCLALPFVPLGRAGRRALRQGGSTTERMARHCAAVTEAATVASLTLQRLADWAARATSATARIKGDSAARIIAALLAHPQALTATIETDAAISRDTTERLLARMQTMGLVREVTGGRRFRIWSAAS